MTPSPPLPLSTALLIHVLVATEIFFSSRLFFAIDPVLQPVLLAVPVALCLWASVLLALRLEILPVVGAIAYAVLLVVEVQQFSKVTGFPQNINTLFQFGWCITFPFLYIVVRQNGLPYLLKAIVVYSFVYLIIYIIIAGSAQAGIQALLGRFLVAKDVERGERVFMSLAPALVVWFWGLEQARAKREWGTVALVVSALAIFYAQSRVFTASVAIVTLLWLMGTSKRLISIICIGAFLVSAGILCYGIFDIRWNPFEFFGSDSSGIARKKAYAIATHFVRANQFFGMGLPGNPLALGYVVQDDYFAPSDLGPLGTWFSLGSIGLLVLTVLTVIACTYRFRASLSTVENNTLFLVGCTLGLYGIIAPTLIFGAGFYGSIFVACWLDSLRMRFSGPSPPRRLSLRADRKRADGSFVPR